MKRLFTILFIVIGTLMINAQSQCSPDPQFTAPGIYPDSATGLSDAIVAQQYSEMITVITPLDTNVVYAGIALDVTIDFIELTAVTGLPPNFTYDCDPASCSFPGGFTGCAEIYSTTDPTVADIGIYPITFNTTTQVSGIPIIQTTTQDDVTSGYYIEILDNVNSVIDRYNSSTFDLKGAYPNPCNNKTQIQFISGINQQIYFEISNMLGEVVYSKSLNAISGVNTLNISTFDFSEGMYIFSINNGYSILSNRLIVSN